MIWKHPRALVKENQQWGGSGAELECGHQNRSGGAGAASLTCSCCQSLLVFLCQQFHKSLKRNLYYNQPQGRSKKGEEDSTALSFSDSVEVDVLIILIKGRLQGAEWKKFIPLSSFQYLKWWPSDTGFDIGG